MASAASLVAAGFLVLSSHPTALSFLVLFGVALFLGLIVYGLVLCTTGNTLSIFAWMHGTSSIAGGTVAGAHARQRWRVGWGRSW